MDIKKELSEINKNIKTNIGNLNKLHIQHLERIENLINLFSELNINYSVILPTLKNNSTKVHFEITNIDKFKKIKIILYSFTTLVYIDSIKLISLDVNEENSNDIEKLIIEKIINCIYLENLENNLINNFNKILEI